MTETNNHPQVTSTLAGDDGEAVAKSQETVAANGIKATTPMHWYLACVRVNYEKKFETLINKYFLDKNLALETWVPLEKRETINSRGKRVIREAVIITTFVFVRVEKKHLNEIRFRSDVYKMLSVPGKNVPYVIPDAQFENFRRIVDTGKAEIQNRPIRKGDKVRVIDGELVGVIAHVQRIQGKKVIVATEIPSILGASIEINKEQIEYVE